MSKKIEDMFQIKNHLFDNQGELVPFNQLQNKAHALIGPTGSGKTSSLFLLKDYLDTKETLIIDAAYKNELNSRDKGRDDLERFKEIYGVEKNLYKNATCAVLGDDVFLREYKNIIIDEAWLMFLDDDLVLELKDIIKTEKHTVLLTFHEESDAGRLGFKSIDTRYIKSDITAPLVLNKIKQTW